MSEPPPSQKFTHFSGSFLVFLFSQGSLLKTIVFAVITMAFCFSTSAVPVSKGFQTDNINIGYLPERDFGARVGVPELAAYFKKLEAICTEFFANASTAENLDIVIAIKTDQSSKIWFVSSRNPTPIEQRDHLRSKLEAITPPKTSVGPIAFAIQGHIGVGVPNASKETSGPPMPDEWKEVISKLTRTLSFDELLSLVWPTPSLLRTAAIPTDTVLNEFETQILEPTGGKIPRPKGWYYSENHHGNVYLWTISKEDISGNRPYTTGLRIQLFSAIKTNTGKTAKQFIFDAFEKKKKEASKIIKIFEERNQGLFSRIGIEVEEGQNHIIYSMFWGNNDLDLAVVTIAGTTKALWYTYAPAFDRMNAFELIDMKHFNKEEKFVVPEGVKYKEAAVDVNEKAKKLLLTKLSASAANEDVAALFENKLICGPFLWRKIKDDPTVSKIEKGKATFFVNSDQLEGKLFQSRDEVLCFWKAFVKKVDLTNLKVRRLNQEELKIYWAIIAFDIEEPVFIVESLTNKILVQFGSPEKSKIFWIDDFHGIHMKDKKL